MPTRHALTFALSLSVALGACGADEPLPGPGTTPPGVDAGPSTKPPGQTPTWYKDVLPIVRVNCVGCHRASGIGPFKLDTYAAAKGAANAIRFAVAARTMPPWMPSDTCGKFRHARRLTALQIDTVKRWVDGGALEGDKANAPPPKPSSDALPWVDTTLAPASAYVPSKKAGGRADDYHCSILDPKLTSARDLIGYEVVPGARSMVHHVIIFSAKLANAKKKETQAGQGWTCYGGSGVSGATMLGGWVPGTTVTRFPTNTGMRVDAGNVLVAQVHYNFDNLAGKPPTADRTILKVQYAKQPVKTRLFIVPIRDGKFRVPPGAKGYKAGTTYRAALNARLWGILPHMHAFGTRIKVDLRRADGKTECMIDIPKWDFNWQQMYFYDTAVGIPVKLGETFTLTCVYDNSTTRTITWGESTTDEMCLNYLLVSLGI